MRVGPVISGTSTSDEVKAAISAAYKTLGTGLSWTFMTSSEGTLRTARVALVGLNPGGGGRESDYRPIWHQPDGNDYKRSDWKTGHGPGGAPLQIQVQELCKVAATEIDDLFSAQFVPFRSASWSSLTKREDALRFARALWTWVLANSRFETCFTLGHLTGAELARLMQAQEVKSDGRRIEVAWGAQTLRRYKAADGRRIVSLPHLSRYKLFSGDRADQRRAILRVALDF